MAYIRYGRPLCEGSDKDSNYIYRDTNGLLWIENNQGFYTQAEVQALSNILVEALKEWKE